MININDVYISDDDLRELFNAQALSRAKKEFEKLKREAVLDELAKIAQEQDMGYSFRPHIPQHDFLIIHII